MEYTTLRKPPATKGTGGKNAPSRNQCPSGFRWDSKKGKCVQAGVGPEFRP